MALAKAKAVTNFENSAGWILKGPNINHEREPLTSGATTAVTISSKIIIT